jgi:hypothetical protein
LVLTPLPRGNTLDLHGHHSDNTHVILSGVIEFFFKANIVPIFKAQRLDVAADIEYAARARTDTKFIEAHIILSPKTRDRFLSRGDIEWVETLPHEGPVSVEVMMEGNTN